MNLFFIGVMAVYVLRFQLSELLKPPPQVEKMTCFLCHFIDSRSLVFSVFLHDGK